MHSRQSTLMNEVMSNWDSVHWSRHLISPFADCFCDRNINLSHGTKSRFAKISRRNNCDIIYPLNELVHNASSNSIPTNLFDTTIPIYFSLQLDLMNALHFGGDSGERGTSLQSIVTGKMKNVLRRWLCGMSAKELRQAHFHKDDPNYVILHKYAEQKHRDMQRLKTAIKGKEEAQRFESIKSNQVGFQEDLTVPWSSLLKDWRYRDELASLHLVCAAVAGFELLVEKKYPH